MELNEKEQIGKGAQATVYRDGAYAVKVFDKGASKYAVFYEALVNSVIEMTGLPVARTYEVLNLDGRMAIKMEYIRGKSLNDYIFAEPDKTEWYIQKMVDLQTAVHNTSTALPFTLKDRLRERISGSGMIEETAKHRLLNKLSQMPDGRALCHGDFHGYNILLENGRYTIIDWVDASIGYEDADACRTYMLYYFYTEEIAGLYLDLYCRSRGKSRDEVLQWLPVVGAARLSEDNAQETETIKTWLACV